MTTHRQRASIVAVAARIMTASRQRSLPDQAAATKVSKDLTLPTTVIKMTSLGRVSPPSP